jgi:single-strand DNA-binding protein
MGINKAILIGKLGKDPELRYTPGGQPVASFSLATTERWTDKNGQRQDRTEWHNIVVWGKLAELVNQYLKKGRSAYIEGRITNRSWDDKDGNKKYRSEIVATTVEFLGDSKSGASVAPPEMADQGESQETGPADIPAVHEPGAAEEDLPF